MLDFNTLHTGRNSEEILEWNNNGERTIQWDEMGLDLGGMMGIDWGVVNQWGSRALRNWSWGVPIISKQRPLWRVRGVPVSGGQKSYSWLYGKDREDAEGCSGITWWRCNFIQIKTGSRDGRRILNRRKGRKHEEKQWRNLRICIFACANDRRW